MKKTLATIMLLSLSLLCLTLSIQLNSYNKTYYMNSYEENGIMEISGRSKEELSKITDKLIAYLKGHGGEELLKPHFNQREILHMKDVQKLFDLSRWIKWMSFTAIIFILLYFKKIKKMKFLSKTILKGLFINHVIIGSLAILSLYDFNKYFTYFHLLFFTNDLWILDPKTDLMIQMLPEVFFMKMAVNIILLFFILLGILQVLAYIYIKRHRRTR